MRPHGRRAHRDARRRCGGRGDPGQPARGRSGGAGARGARVLLRRAAASQSRLDRGKDAGRGLLRASHALSLLRKALRALPAYLWSGWGAVASLLLMLAGWEWASVLHGDLVLPDPRATGAPLARLLLPHMGERPMAVLMITHDIMEAVRLADTLLVMASSPGRIVRRFAIDLPAGRRDDRFVHDVTASLLQD